MSTKNESNGVLEVHLVQANDKKDVWDKVSSISALLSGVIVVGIGLYATIVFDQRQLDANTAQKERELATLELQTVETFFGHLSSADAGLQKSSLEAINSLRDGSLAMQLAVNLGGTGAEEFLREQAFTTDSSIAIAAKDALNSLRQDRVLMLDSELTYRLRFFNQLLVGDSINDKIMSEVQNILEQTPPSDQDYMIEGALDTTDQLQKLILSLPTREVYLQEHIVDSVPDFQVSHLEQLKLLVSK